MGQALSSTIATAALSNAPLGVLILDKGGRITWLNSALEKLLDIAADRLLGQSAASAEPVWRDLLFTPEETLFLAATATRPARWLQTWRETPPGTDSAVHYYADISDLQNALEDRDRLNEELAQHTTRDAVTGLPNRQALLQGLEPLVSRSRRYHNPLSVIRLRIDNLSDIDSEYGKGNGEVVLTAIAQMLKDQMRWADLIGRFDTDEFLLVLPETDLDAATHLLDKLQQRLAHLTPTSGDGRAITMITRFGAAVWQQGDDRAKLLRRAREQLEQGN
jgi:diguanylate cyclase (GGDEF)-like protein